MSGWIEWNGGICPVNLDIIVEICRRDNYQDQCIASHVNWHHHTHHTDVIRYRVVEKKEPKERKFFVSYSYVCDGEEFTENTEMRLTGKLTSETVGKWEEIIMEESDLNFVTILFFYPLEG